MNDRWEGSRSPRNGQFQKGHSGNPNGRPRKPVAVPEVRRSAFDIVLEKRVTITEGGCERELSVEEALQMRTYKNALDGNRAAQREVLKWIEKRNKAMGHVEQRMTPHAEIRMREGEPRNADESMRLLGIARPTKIEGRYDPDAILLEPWAVQAALSRRRGGKALTPKNIGEIKRCTRSAETLRWPRGTKT
jgi:Family of unknown function (DUF5681)